MPGQIAVDDVVGEAIASALGEQHDKPERMKLEPWLYRLSKQAIHRFSSENWKQRQIGEESVIADPSADTPEELAARRELINLVETTLGDAGHNEREPSSWTPSKGSLWKRSPTSPTAAWRRCVHPFARRASTCNGPSPIEDPLKEKLVEYSRSA